VEEAAAATAAALASRGSASAPSRSTRSDADEYSEGASPVPSPAPHDRPVSMSPAVGMSGVPALQRQASDYSAYMSGMSVPPHLRNELSQPSPRSSPSLNQSYTSAGNNQHRPSLTSHPSSYGPPSVLEPPANTNHGQSGSVNGSPHMGSLGWQSPSQQGLPSPGAPEGYVYPDPHYGAGAPNMYYQNSNLRRPQSTEPDGYDPRQWAPPVQ